VEIESIREKVLAGKYILRGHVAMHALKEGFGCSVMGKPAVQTA
jgi:hypothetical protein